MTLTLQQRLQRDYDREMDRIQSRINLLERSLESAAYLTDSKRARKQAELDSLIDQQKIQLRKGLGGIFKPEPSSIK